MLIRFAPGWAFPFFNSKAVPVSRLFICIFVLSLFAGCYPEPDVEPVVATPEEIERLNKLEFPSGDSARSPAQNRASESSQSEK